MLVDRVGAMRSTGWGCQILAGSARLAESLLGGRRTTHPHAKQTTTDLQDYLPATMGRMRGQYCAVLVRGRIAPWICQVLSRMRVAFG